MKIVNTDLKNYIENNILIQYMDYDNAHNLDHINTVINESLEIANDFDVDINMIYTIASYHDIGIKFGRNDHNITSAQYLRNDENIKTFFTASQISIISDAIEDHRASNTSKPRTIYGMIVSEADRTIDIPAIIFRSMEYSKHYNPEYSFNQHYDKIFAHLEKKYSENGYLKLWLKTEKNEKNLLKLQQLLKNKHQLKKLWSQYNID